MSHPTYCCSASLNRCLRCDLLVGLEGFHLVAIARRECGLVFDIESCDRVARATHAGACLIVCVSVFCLKGLMHDE